MIEFGIEYGQLVSKLNIPTLKLMIRESIVTFYSLSVFALIMQIIYSCCYYYIFIFYVLSHYSYSYFIIYIKLTSKIIPFIAFHFQNINPMQQLILMLKKSKKQRKAFDFKEVESIKQPQDYSANNSSSIIAIDEYSHQTSQQHLTFKPNVHEPQVIKISATKTLDFQDQCMQNEQFKQEIVSITDIGVSHSIQERKEEEELDEKKETVTTNNDSSRQEIHKKAMIEKIQEKALTEHFSYASEQQQSEDEQEIQQMDTRSQKVLKNFVAETLDDLIFAQIPQNCNVTCAVSFNHQFLSFSRKYDLFLVREKKYLFSAVKQRLKLTSQFEFIRNGDKKQSPVGYLKSNFTGLQFVANKVHRNEGDRQTEVCWIGYEFNMLGLSSQRSITVLKNKNAKLQKIQNFSKIKNYYENGITENFEKFSTKKAVVNREGEYELDFHGKVNKPSGKNFILVNTKQKQCILFGKRTDNTFVLQIGYPFSIFEGFAIAISSLDHKLCVR